MPHAFWRLGASFLLSIGAAIAGAGAGAQESAAPLAPDATLKIAVFTGERPDWCYDTGYAAAIETLSRVEAERVNRTGLLGARRLELTFLQGDVDAETAVSGIREALADPALLGLVGMRRSSVATESFESVGREILDSGAPFFTGVSVTSLFEPYPNIFSMRVSEEHERIPAMRSFLRDAGYDRPAFVGRRDVVYSEALGDGLARRDAQTIGPALVADLRLDMPSRSEATPEQVRETVAALREAEADIVFLHVGTRRSAPFLEEMIATGYTPAIFVTGRIEGLFGPDRLQRFPEPIYRLAWEAPPHIQSERLRRLISELKDEALVFGGRENETSPRWEQGECREEPDRLWDSVYAAGNLRAAMRGAEYADMVGLIAEAAASAPRDATLETLRAHVVETIKQRYAAGRGAFEGRIANWSFRPETRTATRTPVIVERPAAADAQRLAPVQYVSLRQDALRPVQTYYMDLDLVRIFRVDDNQGTFFADFYVSLFDGEGASLERIEFGNAFLDPETNKRTVEIVELHDGGASEAYPRGMKLYRVSGRFMFEPSFEVYPFDRQRFSIDIQPKRGDEAFILQPPAPELRDPAARTEGWSIVEQYVSYDEDFTPLVDARSGERSIAPYYKASFVWIMDRQATDYYLRVAIPLIVLLAIAYFSVFISKESFEAKVTIQVTALLSAVALYLAIPKVDSNTATLSDKIFLADYIAVFVMIATTILSANKGVRRIPLLPRVFDVIHVIAVPVLVGFMGYYVYEISRPKIEDRSAIEEAGEEDGVSLLEASFRRLSQ